MIAPSSPFAVSPRFTEAHAAGLESALKVLADKTRLMILALLSEHGPMTVAALVPRLGLTQATVSHHCKMLDGAGFTAVIQTESGPRREIDNDAVLRVAVLINPYGRDGLASRSSIATEYADRLAAELIDEASR